VLLDDKPVKLIASCHFLLRRVRDFDAGGAGAACAACTGNAGHRSGRVPRPKGTLPWPGTAYKNRASIASVAAVMRTRWLGAAYKDCIYRLGEESYC
jgi:hypothetical protein